MARAGRGFHLVADVPGVAPIALTSDAVQPPPPLQPPRPCADGRAQAFDDCINRVIEDTRSARQLKGVVPCTLVNSSAAQAAGEATPHAPDAAASSAAPLSRRRPAADGSSASSSDAAAAAAPLMLLSEGSLPPSPPAVGTASESMHRREQPSLLTPRLACRAHPAPTTAPALTSPSRMPPPSPGRGRASAGRSRFAPCVA